MAPTGLESDGDGENPKTMNALRPAVMVCVCRCMNVVWACVSVGVWMYGWTCVLGNRLALTAQHNTHNYAHKRAALLTRSVHGCPDAWAHASDSHT